MADSRDTTPMIVSHSTFHWGNRTYIMGVLNVTPDSFSDGGDWMGVQTALAGAEKLISNGADILDIGGQSTRPGALEVSLAEELNRVVPVVQALRNSSAAGATIPISIDTTRSQVARAAIKAGADIINDISGATFDPEMLPTVAELAVPIILMHIRGNPQTMQTLTDYDDLIGEINTFLSQRIEAATAVGIPNSNIIIDPGIGFAKTYSQNLELIRRLPEFSTLGYPLLAGVSRKSFIGHILNQPNPKNRVWGTAAACTAAIAGGADILRVHDVAEIRDVARVADAIYRKG